MKISRRDQKTLLYVIGVLLLLAVYFLYFKNKQEEINNLQSEVDKLHAEVIELKDYEINSKKYERDTQQYYQEIDDMADDFPAEIKEEDVIIYGRELETSKGVSISTLSMTAPALLNSFGLGERQKHLYCTVVNVNFSGTYDTVKEMINAVQTDADKRNITTLSLSYDSSTGNLSGTAAMNLYALYGRGQRYETPDPGSVPLGTKNIFGQ